MMKLNTPVFARKLPGDSILPGGNRRETLPLLWLRVLWFPEVVASVAVFALAIVLVVVVVVLLSGSDPGVIVSWVDLVMEVEFITAWPFSHRHHSICTDSAYAPTPHVAIDGGYRKSSLLALRGEGEEMYAPIRVPSCVVPSNSYPVIAIHV